MEIPEGFKPYIAKEGSKEFELVELADIPNHRFVVFCDLGVDKFSFEEMKKEENNGHYIVVPGYVKEV